MKDAFVFHGPGRYDISIGRASRIPPNNPKKTFTVKHWWYVLL